MEKKGRERKSSVRGRMREGRREKGRERVCGTKGERGRERQTERQRERERERERETDHGGTQICFVIFLLLFVLAL